MIQLIKFEARSLSKPHYEGVTSLDEVRRRKELNQELVRIGQGQVRADGSVEVYNPQEVTRNLNIWKLPEVVLCVGEDSLPISLGAELRQGDASLIINDPNYCSHVVLRYKSAQDRAPHLKLV